MCGIAGILTFDARPVQEESLRQITDRIEHRGRDAFGLVLGGQGPGERGLSAYPGVGLAHRRLSIIDLSDRGAQPMSYAQGRFWITYNGEIYNYVELRAELAQQGHAFHSDSDTEVILAAYAAWGEQCVERFNGMFAFALWDEDRRRLFCARDPLGIKPFYYVSTPQYFAFASESGALVGLSGGLLDRDAVAAYLQGMYVPGPWSIFEGVRKLPPAHTLTLAASGEATLRRYWQVEHFADRPDDPARRAEVETLLGDAVKRQLRSDVPVGVFLSGGIDSSLVAALAALQVPGIHTFSVGYEGASVNELPYAGQVADRYKTTHHELMLQADELLPNLDKALAHSNEPVADSAIVATYMLAGMAAQEGVKVLLNGTGGDEVFGGYPRYVGSSFKRQLLHLTPGVVRRTVGRWLPQQQAHLAARLRHLGFDLLSNTGSVDGLAEHFLGDNGHYDAFIERMVADCFPPVRARLPDVYNRMLFDLNVYVADELLVLLDQMTMAWTLEGRVPLLDVDVIAAAFRLPPESHVGQGQLKRLLKDLAAPYLGEAFVQRQKQGFGGPVPYWVNGNLEAMREVVREVPNMPFFEDFTVDPLLVSGPTVDRTTAETLFRLYCLRRWYEHVHDLDGCPIL